MDFKKPETVLDLNNIRVALIRMEDTILFDLIERAQFYTSPAIYDASQLTIPGTNKSLLDFLLLESEKTHALVRRYEAPDELPFFPDEIAQLNKPGRLLRQSCNYSLQNQQIIPSVLFTSATFPLLRIITAPAPQRTVKCRASTSPEKVRLYM